MKSLGDTCLYLPIDYDDDNEEDTAGGGGGCGGCGCGGGGCGCSGGGSSGEHDKHDECDEHVLEQLNTNMHMITQDRQTNHS